MKNFEKETIQAQLTDEQKALQDLQKAYKQAKKDCQEKIRLLNARKDMQNLQSIVHQKKYQQALMKQIDGVLNDLQTHTYKTANEFFQGSYQNGYIGSMYELQKQGIPITVPVSTKKMVRAIQTDSKLSQGYYLKQGLSVQNIRTLKKQIALEATRGIASGKSWLEVAESLSIQRYFQISESDAMRICRTEGNRINQQARLDAGDEAVKSGCDLLKQWDATLDGVTRPAHREADGQIVEWDEDFTVMGEKLPAPSIGGSASNVINCRCQLLKRPRWALDEEELETLKKRAEFYGLDKSKSFEDYKQKFLQIPEKVKDTIAKAVVSKVITTPQKSDDANYNELIDRLEGVRKAGYKLDYNPVQDVTKKRTEEEIIKVIAGGDKTKGSCASVALSYLGQMQGWDVRDFRDGESRFFFSRSGNLLTWGKMKGMKILQAEGASSMTVGNRLLKMMEAGKQYYFSIGRHASIVRKTAEGVIEYLELQSSTDNGWTRFNGNPRYTLKTRFGCTNTSGTGSAYYDFLLDIGESDLGTDDFKTLLGYLNTAEDQQRKGAGGTIK